MILSISQYLQTGAVCFGFHSSMGRPSIGRLRVGRCVIKEYGSLAQSRGHSGGISGRGWPHRIDDPLSPLGDIEPKCRLHDTIKRLNRHHKDRIIHFRGDGTGEGVCWEYVIGPLLPFPICKNATRARRINGLVRAWRNERLRMSAANSFRAHLVAIGLILPPKSAQIGPRSAPDKAKDACHTVAVKIYTWDSIRKGNRE